MRELLALALLELAAAQRPNVLVLIMDDLRAFPGMNAPYVHTPNMLRLASRGVHGARVLALRYTLSPHATREEQVAQLTKECKARGESAERARSFDASEQVL